MQEFREILVEINRQKRGRQALPLQETETAGDLAKQCPMQEQDASKQRQDAPAVLRFAAEDACVFVTIERTGDCLTGRVKAQLKAEAFRENDGFAMEAPVRLTLAPFKQPKRITALYLHRDWWTRPAFLQDFSQVPERTQCMYLDYGDHYGCLYLMAGDEYKTMACAGRADALTLELTAYQPGGLSLEEPVFVLGEGKTPYEAVEAAARMAAAQKGILTREDKKLPDMFEYLGWCSWDAFYTEISAEKVLQKAEELKEKNVPVRWLLLDDGWLSVRDNRLYDLKPEKSKFPEEFLPLTKQLKAGGSFMQIGVWHALGGYWGGIEPGSDAAREQAKHLYKTKTGKLLPAPDAEAGYGFYRDWYEYLRRQGIDFVKVDGQSAVKNYYANDLAVCYAARETHKALEGAAAAYMNGNLINCMGMGMENIMGRQGSALSRNSDDFVPDDPKGFTEHLMQNAYNAPYHDMFYYCDWDMFWTSHKDAQKHAVLRAISGGPVYVSDRIGQTDPAAVKPLAYGDGRLLRMERTAKPSPDCLFCDPVTAGAMKLTNLADCGSAQGKGGAVAVYNLTQRAVETCVSAKDVYDLPDGAYFCYDWMRRQGAVGDHTAAFEPGDFGLYLFVPYKEKLAILGLTEKYISFHALEEVKYLPDGFLAVVRESGEFAFYTEKQVKQVLVNGVDLTDQVSVDNGIFRVTTTGGGRMIVQAVLE